jgi:AcrR family transcriptional regulator
MARPKSEEKRNKLLSVAAQVFANNGLSASTASITNAAGMAEGTLFVYFKGKDDLINALYEDIKEDLGEAMLSEYPRKGSTKSQIKHVWHRYIEWGMENPEKLAALHKIKVWEGLRPEVRDAMMARFLEIHSAYEAGIKDKTFQKVPYEFVMAMLSAQADTTMQFMRQNPKEADLYEDKGFKIFWNGITRKG